VCALTEQAFLSAGYISSLAGLISACGLWIFFVFSYLKGLAGRATLFASTASALWLLTLWVAYAAPRIFGIALGVAAVLEIAVYLLWQLVLFRALGVVPERGRVSVDRTKQVLFWGVMALGSAGMLAVLAHSVLVLIEPASVGPGSLVVLAQSIGRLLVAVSGLVILEQVLRNTRRDNHWNPKYLVIGLTILFGYAFVMYADALLFQRQAPALLAVQGAAVAVSAPFLVLGTLRHRAHRMSINPSRRLVFRTGALALMGVYLLLVGLGGLWLRFVHGDWGDFLAVLFVLITIATGIALAASRNLRDKLSLALARNLFQRKHDYGERWAQITAALLSESDEASLGQRAVRALGDIVHAHRGALWRMGESGVLQPAAQLHTDWELPFPKDVSQLVAQAFSIDASPLLTTNNRRADEVRDLVASHLARVDGAYLAIPLQLPDRLYGLVLLVEPSTHEALEWEDLELLALAARQIASFLAQYDAQEALAQSRQLDAFNQMTAFVVHDLKTVVAQLSLMVGNAERHRQTPGFFDDMISTSAHAVDRMQVLLGHLREQRTGVTASLEMVPLRRAVEHVIERQRIRTPVPELIECEPDLRVRANPDRLETVIGHLVQNAQEVSGDDGRVFIAVFRDGDWIVTRIEDDGPGMDSEFIDTRLFRPFASTKGLAGMGVGTWQAREYVRLLGGDIRVESQPGRGSVFSILLPPASLPDDGAATSHSELDQETSSRTSESGEASSA
jgi:putative PEP-CTERM system histidine kinase